MTQETIQNTLRQLVLLDFHSVSQLKSELLNLVVAIQTENAIEKFRAQTEVSIRFQTFHASIPTALYHTCQNYINEGHKIAAIRDLRNFTKEGLKDCKWAVDNWVAGLA